MSGKNSLQSQFRLIPFDKLSNDPVVNLSMFADYNSLSAIDIVKRAQAFPSLEGFEWAVEAMEAVGLDPFDVSMEDAARADRILQSRVQSVIDMLTERESRRRPKDAEETFEDPVKTSKRQKMFGHPLTSVIRWMGAEGLSLSQSKAIFARLGIKVAEATIRAQLHAGRKGERGEPAKLTDEQIDEVYGLLD